MTLAGPQELQAALGRRPVPAVEGLHRLRPQPQSSGLAVIQALMMLEHTDIGARGPTDPIAWTLLAQAERVMYADRDRYVGDPSFVTVPVDGLLDPKYVAERAKLITTRPGAPPFGHPKGAPKVGVDMTREPGGTTHWSWSIRPATSCR
jgi:gamma-glutamyltranspeptidase/glutathione hydrolase